MQENDESYKIHDETYDKPRQSFISEILFATITKLVKFLGLILIPYFLFFIIVNLVTRIKNKESIKWNFDSMTILLCTCNNATACNVWVFERY